MKTPMQELINQVEQWMIEDKYVQDNPLDYEEYMVHYANQMIEVKGKFIDMCKAMLEKETQKDQMHKVWNDSRINFARASNGFDFYTSFEDYYNETFNTKEK